MTPIDEEVPDERSDRIGAETLPVHSWIEIEIDRGLLKK